MKLGILAVAAVFAAAGGVRADDFDYAAWRDASEIVLPDTVEVVTNSAMRSFASLRKITIPSSVVEIEAQAFADCTNLEEVVFSGAGLEAIGAGAFSNCTSLAKIELPWSVKTVSNHAFAGCTSLAAAFTIPENVSTLGAGVFHGDTQISFVRYLGNLPSSVDTNLYSGTSSELKSGCLRFRKGWSSAGSSTKTTPSSGSSDTSDDSGGEAEVDDGGEEEEEEDEEFYDDYYYPDAAAAVLPRKAGASVTIHDDFPRKWPAGRFARKLYIWNASSTNYFTVKLDLNGGEFSESSATNRYWYWKSPARQYGELPEAELDGYEFNGWEKVQGSGVYVAETDEVSASCTLYASWSEDDSGRETAGFDALYDDDGEYSSPAAATFSGYVLSDGLSGTATLKTSKTGAATLTVKLYESGKKYVFSGVLDEDGTMSAFAKSDSEIELELAVTENAFTASFDEYTIDGAKDVSKAGKQRLAQWAGAKCAVFGEGDEAAGFVSIKIAASGKVSAKGVVDGKQVSASSKLIAGDACAAAPLYFKKAGLACVLWLDRSAPQLAQFSDSSLETIAFGAPSLPDDGTAEWVLDDAAFEFPGDWDVMDEYLPGTMEITIANGKISAPPAGRVKYSRAEEDFVVSGNEENPAGLKLSYQGSTGIARGSFKVYRALSEKRLKAVAATVWGVAIDGTIYLSAAIRNAASAPATIE